MFLFKNKLILTGHTQPTNNVCPTPWQATRKTMTSLSHAYRSVSGGICEMFYSFSTAHCKTRSYKGMETMNTERLGSSSNFCGERLKLIFQPIYMLYDLHCASQCSCWVQSSAKKCWAYWSKTIA